CGDDEVMKVVLTVWWTWDGDGFGGEDGVEGVGCGGCVAAVCGGQRVISTFLFLEFEDALRLLLVGL
nr:hypothetical protein [Tanacetum cinerariifolium]